MPFKKAKKQVTLATLAGLVLLTPLPGQSALPTCSSSAFDPDSDGWGWENNATCIHNLGNLETFSSTRTRTTTYCQYLSSDDNNDGWGWENNSSCKINEDSRTDNSDDSATGNSNDSGTRSNSVVSAVCQTTDADPDGDGFGWEHNASCIAKKTTTANANTSARPTCINANADPDGDGFGWENNTSCIVTTSSARATDSDNNGSSTATAIKKVYLPSDITDLVLITGQSNTLGASTAVNSSLDARNKRVFAYTSEGWQVAELYQIWDRGSSPGEGDPNSSLADRHNNFALHFGKKLATIKIPGKAGGI